jgi:cytochrome P450/NADPH-cytochrome P450 reductase
VLDLLEEHMACELTFPAISRNAAGHGAALLFDLVLAEAMAGRLFVTVGVVEGPARSGKGDYKGTCSTYLADKAKGDTCVRLDQGDQGRLPHARRSVDADHHDRPRYRAGAVPRLPAGARDAEGQWRALGQAMLFFGCRPGRGLSSTARNWRPWRRKALSTFRSLSRAPAKGEKTYVQDLIRAERAKPCGASSGLAHTFMSAAMAAAWSRTLSAR